MRMMTGRRLTDGTCGNAAQPGWMSSRQSLGMSCCLLSCPLWSRSFGYAQHSAGLGLTHRFQWEVLYFCRGFARYCLGGMNLNPKALHGISRVSPELFHHLKEHFRTCHPKRQNESVQEEDWRACKAPFWHWVPSARAALIDC